MTKVRSETYWREFGRRADLQAVSVETGKRVTKSGRGGFLVELSHKMVSAGLWRDVELKHWKARVWIPLETIPFTDHAARVRAVHAHAEKRLADA